MRIWGVFLLEKWYNGHMMNTVYKIMVSGLVQGIGFRPFVAELAETHNLTGQVKNLGGIVEIIVSGEKKAVDAFVQCLKSVGSNGELPGCRLDALDVTEVEQEKWEALCLGGRFHIVESTSGREAKRFLPVDLPTCDRCIAEMHEKGNRRYRYPFISCTACGPRFSIQKAVPYDRETITMDDFPMCEACKKEYTEKGNIRRHAQTIACKECGPRLRYVEVDEQSREGGQGMHDFLQIAEEQQAISKAIQALLQGKIGAVKDIGGYHFAFLPTNSEAASRLRAFKNRDKKPFAVMFLNLDEVQEYCEVSEKEAALLTSSARPIVLLKKKKDFVPEICGESDRIGALLPCNPLQILLLEETGPLVMTSGNRGGEPIIISEEEMSSYLGNGIDFMLTHNREILTPLDDSIYHVTEIEDPSDGSAKKESRVQLIRRARGLAPEPIRLPRKLAVDTLAAGGDLKAVFALGRDELAYLSQYYGDLEDVRCAESRDTGIRHMKALLEIHPEKTVGDLHPAYFSTQNMETKIQHHHAHVASVIAENGLEGKVLGVACDGTGFGTDGTIWGSEFLLCENEKMVRAGHFSSVKLVGGDTSAKQADLTLYSYMLEAQERGYEVEQFLAEQELFCTNSHGKLDEATIQKLKLQEMAWKQNINTTYSSSMGRLFDAAAALLDICHSNSYEGECAIKLEQAAHRGKLEMESMPSPEVDALQKIVRIACMKTDGTWQANSVKLLVDLYCMKGNYSKEVLAYLFHLTIADAIIEIAGKICEEHGIKQVALSGGTFINRILLSEVVQGLVARDKQVYTNEKVPCGDGGIALGQMYLATF